MHDARTKTDVKLVERRKPDDNCRVRALGLHMADEAREAPEHVEERDCRAQRAAGAAEEDVCVNLKVQYTATQYHAVNRARGPARTVLRFLRVIMQVSGIPMIDTMLPG